MNNKQILAEIKSIRNKDLRTGSSELRANRYYALKRHDHLIAMYRLNLLKQIDKATGKQKELLIKELTINELTKYDLGIPWKKFPRCRN